MIGIFSAAKVKELDAKEIELEGISSFQLMQRASEALCLEIENTLQKSSVDTIVVLASGGNNGGDALCVADMLSDKYKVVVFYIKVSDRQSTDFAQAYSKIKDKLDVFEISSAEDVRKMSPYLLLNNICIIDGLLGSGINRVVNKDSFLGCVIDHINNTRKKETSILIAIDLPSGLLGEDNELSNNSRSIINADYTICLQYPKLSTLMPECEKYVGCMTYVDFDMKLMKDGSGDIGYLIEKADICKLIKSRPKHGHKGTFGKALLVAGSKEMPGACMLAAKSAMRSGLGMLYVLTHENVKPFLLNYLPEAICKTDSSVFDSLYNSTDSIAVGPGLGTDDYATHIFSLCLNCQTHPMVMDADALNLLSQNFGLIKSLPKNTILTPHPAEFQRLFGKCSSRKEMIARQIEMAKEHDLIIVLKGAFTTITDGNDLVFNSTGNSGMATAGSGDVLTGIILSLLTQGYEPFDAAKLGVYIHGLSGDIAAKKLSEYSLIASDIVDNIPCAFQEILRI